MKRKTNRHCFILLFISLLSAENAQLLQWPLFPFVQCTIRLSILLFNFDIGKYDDYISYFEDNSVMVLAQAREYKAAKAIEEYVEFIDLNFNLFVQVQELKEKESAYLGYDRENMFVPNSTH